jgi:hypothetical protein
MALIEMPKDHHLLIPGSTCYNCLGQFPNYNIYSKAILTCPIYSLNESSGKPEEDPLIIARDSLTVAIG